MSASWRWDLRGEAFGSDAPAEDPDQDGVALRFDLRFPGQRHDPVSGLNYNYFRDYEPATGRYLQSDPIGLEGGWSTYAYALSSPVKNSDSSGLITTLVTTYDYGIGSHSAIHVAIEGRPDFLYDPAGSYNPGGRRGSGGVFSGDDASLSSYKKYQESTGSRVELTVIPLSIKQEERLIGNSEEIGDPRGLWCAGSVSGALSGMCGVGFTVFPGRLNRMAKGAVCTVD